MDYEAVYLQKNSYIREESMQTIYYLKLFYPFEKLDLTKHGIESLWNINEDRMMMVLAMTFAKQPMAMQMCFQRQYAGRNNPIYDKRPSPKNGDGLPIIRYSAMTSSMILAPSRKLFWNSRHSAID